MAQRVCRMKSRVWPVSASDQAVLLTRQCFWPGSASDTCSRRICAIFGPSLFTITTHTNSRKYFCLTLKYKHNMHTHRQGHTHIHTHRQGHIPTHTQTKYTILLTFVKPEMLTSFIPSRSDITDMHGQQRLTHLLNLNLVWNQMCD